ncbi:Co2+/Mg2+ efflux protein ApaG [Pedobacter sp. MC2016-14]|uniref:Co2+/Mg2+ efflux protein ApaG n=1 Tax=Pedobacter sp. MC2016-14 TaxID=2897327 RepID=UPI001E55AA19|nr:Co2+/Mg2+ efflux protein ApaG [Pedobacter sp. MC2016-14]MCD0487291.1 Co2+/Mg2+ efflux protein ApaG [Pedobacter sp. MC2016-14]
MVTGITEGVKISVETVFQDEFSNPMNEVFLFAYKIEIQNLTDQYIQLKRRNWTIFDSNGSVREVEGSGVVGEQPIIAPGNAHSYVSACNLTTDMGSMKGYYSMTRFPDESVFQVEIPQFELIAPHRLN